MEDLCPTSHNVSVPFVKREEYQMLTADGDTGAVSLLTESGETKDDLNLPTFVSVGEPTDDDKKITEEILKWLDEGKDFKSSSCQHVDRRKSSRRRRHSEAEQ